MFSERDDFQERGGRGGFSVTIALIVANVLTFLAQLAIERSNHWPFMYWLALSVPGIKSGHLWQLLTFQFLHGGWIHLLLNCWALHLFGRDLEARLGRLNFLKLYLFSGIIGGLVQLLCAVLAPKLFGGLLVGASAGVFGLIAAYAALFPEREFTLLVFFVLPVTLRAKTLLLWGTVLAIVGALLPFDNVAHAAHLGGMLGGLVCLNWMRGVKPFAG